MSKISVVHNVLKKMGEGYIHIHILKLGISLEAKESTSVLS